MGVEPTAAAQVMITIIPIVGIVVGGVIVFFFLFWRHRQRMEVIRQGREPHDAFDVRSFSLLAGLVSGAVGLVLTLFMMIKDGAGYSLLGGLIPLSAGISLVVYSFLHRDAGPR